ncbi:MAG: hypothetical protein WCJ64_02055, partial [Rhodospirillaceae bacterium]
SLSLPYDTFLFRSCARPNIASITQKDDLAVMLLDTAGLYHPADADDVIDQSLGCGGGELDTATISEDFAVVLDQGVQRLAVAAEHLLGRLVVHGEVDLLIAIEVDGELVARGQGHLSQAGGNGAVVDNAWGDKGSKASIGDADPPLVLDDAGGLRVALEVVAVGVEVLDLEVVGGGDQGEATRIAEYYALSPNRPRTLAVRALILRPI